MVIDNTDDANADIHLKEAREMIQKGVPSCDKPLENATKIINGDIPKPPSFLLKGLLPKGHMMQEQSEVLLQIQLFAAFQGKLLFEMSSKDTGARVVYTCKGNCGGDEKGRVQIKGTRVTVRDVNSQKAKRTHGGPFTVEYSYECMCRIKNPPFVEYLNNMDCKYYPRSVIIYFMRSLFHAK